MRIFILVWLLAFPAIAQVTPQLALARICASEEGIDRITDGCAAIHQVLLRGARRNHMSYLAFAHAYSPGVFDGSRGRPWIADLTSAGLEPARWPTVITRRRGGQVVVRRAPSWSVYREHWLDLYAHAGMILRGEIVNFCELPPDAWGCPLDPGRQCLDHVGAAARGWIVISCGETENEFWVIPRLHDEDLTNLGPLEE